jgi:hypothetical protein
MGSSDSKTEAKKEAIKFLGDEYDDFINVVIYLVTIKKSTKGK